MAYRVQVLPRARFDLRAIRLRIRVQHSEPAALWFEGLKQALRSLAEIPERCPVTPEAPDLRHLLYGRPPNVYRVIYKISEKPRRVEVWHIRHGAQQPFTAADLNGPSRATTRATLVELFQALGPSFQKQIAEAQTR